MRASPWWHPLLGSPPGCEEGVNQPAGVPRARPSARAICEHVFVRWDNLTVEAEESRTLPGYREPATVRTFDAPEALDTRFYEVRSKSALNRVPKASRMPFRWTINPYRGCAHACAFCASGDTPVLMADGCPSPTCRAPCCRRASTAPCVIRLESTGIIAARWSSTTGRQSSPRGVSFSTMDEARCERRPSVPVSARVEARDRDRAWRTASETASDRWDESCMGTGAFCRGSRLFTRLPPRLPLRDRPRRRLVLKSYVRVGEEGHRRPVAPFPARARRSRGPRPRPANIWRRRVCFSGRSVSARRPTHAGRCALSAPGRRANVDLVRSLVEWPRSPADDWRKGYLAGIFDAEGASPSGEALRIANMRSGDPRLDGGLLASIRLPDSVRRSRS